MKKIPLLLIAVLLSTAVMAQKTLPVIKAGTKVDMDVDFHDQLLQLTIAYKSLGDPTNISWDVSGTGGSYTMTAKGLEAGTKFNVEQPQPNAVTPLTDDETFMCISKTAYKSLLKDKTFTYSGLVFTAKDNSDGFKLDGKMIDATYLTTADGKTTLWILNNPELPITLVMKGNPAGVDYTATSIK